MKTTRNLTMTELETVTGGNVLEDIASPVVWVGEKIIAPVGKWVWDVVSSPIKWIFG